MYEDINDDRKLKRRWINKKYNAKKEGLSCELTYDEYCQKVRDANLKSSDLGFTGNNYVLARYNDEGDYTPGNCRFITQAENAREKKNSEKNRKASSEKIKKYNASLTEQERAIINAKIKDTYAKKLAAGRRPDTSHLQPTEKKVEDDILIEKLKSSPNIKQALESAGLALAGKNYDRAKKLLKSHTTET
jgi:hypothetical protein